MSVIQHHTTLPDESEKTDFYGLIDNATVSGIVNDDIASSAAIEDIKLDTIRTNGKVAGSALVELQNIPVGAGLIPVANISTTVVNYLVPTGGIIMWSGTILSIPSGWLLCDGSNSTPDLRNRFIVGADADDSGVAKSTITGSALQTSDTGVMPAHTHTVKSSGGAGTGYATAGFNTLSDVTGSTGTGTKVIAVFYALAFIQKS